MCKISIIVPVYNTEPYLSRCFDSILDQSFVDFELLVVDDGSTDRSGVICDAYAAKDDRVRVFHKENGGVSSARNIGIDNAQGDWLYFVDSDDELLQDGLQTLVNCISEDVDVVMGGFEEVDEEGRVHWEAGTIESFRLTRKQSATTMFTGCGLGFFYMGYTWMRMFRNSIVKHLGIRFDTGIAIKEDTLFIMKYICRSNGVTQYTTKPVYRYYQRPDSAMGKTKHGFEPKYIGSFYALVEMKHEMEAVFDARSEAIYIAKQAVYDRYDVIVGMMDDNHVEDETLRKELYDILRKEMGSVFLFKVRRKLRKFV